MTIIKRENYYSLILSLCENLRVLLIIMSFYQTLAMNQYYRIMLPPPIVMHSDGSSNNTGNYQGNSLAVHWKVYSEFCQLACPLYV